MTLYADAHNRQDERRTLEYFRERWPGFVWGWASENDSSASVSPFDFTASRPDGMVVSVIEFKRRHFVWGDWPTILLSRGKVERMPSPDGAGRVFLIEDRIGNLRWVDLAEARVSMIRPGGRTVQTRCEADVEECYYIPARLFRDGRRLPPIGVRCALLDHEKPVEPVPEQATLF